MTYIGENSPNRSAELSQLEIKSKVPAYITYIINLNLYIRPHIKLSR